MSPHRLLHLPLRLGPGCHVSGAANGVGSWCQGVSSVENKTYRVAMTLFGSAIIG